MSDIDQHEILEGYKRLGLYLVIILGICAILTLYLMHLYSTGNPQMFNLTNDSYEHLKNWNSSVNMTEALKPVVLDVSYV
jgi:hypothetical protein